MVTTHTDTAAELARHLHEAALDYRTGRSTYILTNLRLKGLWALIDRQDAHLDVLRELATLEACHVEPSLSGHR